MEDAAAPAAAAEEAGKLLFVASSPLGFQVKKHVPVKVGRGWNAARNGQYSNISSPCQFQMI